jgi:transcriptional regulator with GAF, ATPase, and Fis domain
MSYLELKSDSDTIFQRYPLIKRITSIGSSAENDIVLKGLDDTHCHIMLDGDKFILSEMNSKSPVLVNGKRRRKHNLVESDAIVIADFKLVFHLTDSATSTRETPKPESDSYRALYDFTRLLWGEYDIDALLIKLLDEVIALSKADKGFLIIIEGKDPLLKAARNVGHQDISKSLDQLSDSILQKVMKTQQAIIVEDAVNDTIFGASQSVIDLSLASVMCVPLALGGEMLGMIYLGNNQVSNLFTPNDLEKVSIYSAQAALLVRNAELISDLKTENIQLTTEIEQMKFGEIIGSCDSMQKVFNIIDKVATSDVSVLIQGETGTGKELVAHEIHRRSNRDGGPFIAINCGAIQETLLESELFGHRKGSFTGAIADKIGHLQASDKGTIFLDEIGELPMNLQVKLLRFLQDKMVTRVGDTRPEQVDTRILAATNKVLEQEIENNNFREDLFYRLNVVTIDLPPLKDRGDDLVLIANFLLDLYSKEFGKTTKGFSRESLIAIKKFDWPGNVRQLENKIKKALVMADKPLIYPDDLDLTIEKLPKILPLAKAKEFFQEEYIDEILLLNSGNRTKTAQDLEVDPRTIYRHLARKNKQDTDDL